MSAGRLTPLARKRHRRWEVAIRGVSCGWIGTDQRLGGGLRKAETILASADCAVAARKGPTPTIEAMMAAASPGVSLTSGRWVR